MAENQTNKERLKEITSSIETGIQELFQSEKYMNYLRTMSRFHKYSLNNTMLIHLQRPDATLVAGFNKWEQKFNRHVKRGEKGIKIIAPTPFKKKIEQEKLDPDTKLPMLDKDGNVIMEEKEIKIPMYKPVTVFDVSQTYGEPLPTLAADLKGDVKNYEIFMEALRRSSPVPIELKDIAGNMDGFFSLDDQSITLREGMSEVQTICAAVHEIAHAKLHNTKAPPEPVEEWKVVMESPGGVKRDHMSGFASLEAAEAFADSQNWHFEDENGFVWTLNVEKDSTTPEIVKKDRNTEEVEAESISFAVCSYYGIETGENSFGYIASWSDGKDLKELRASLETINKTADGLISDIDRNFAEICKERGIDLSQEQAGTAPVVPGESVSGDGKAPETEQAERFYRVNEAQFLHIQRSEDGYDYTFYDAASKTAMDGGRLDNPDLYIFEAAKEVCALHGLSTDELSLEAGELPEDFTETTSAPRDYHSELIEHFAREDDALWNTDTKLDEYPVPDKDYGAADLEQHGIYDQDFLPISKEMAAELIERDLTVFAVTYEGTIMAFDRDEVEAYQDGTLFAVLREEWEHTTEFKDAVEDRMNRQQERENAFLNHEGDCFAIYQLKLSGDDMARDLRYMSMDYLQKKGLQPNKDNYELAYTATLPEGGDLNTLWRQFNAEHPVDYMRPSMSVSDIVAIKQDGVLSCHYVDSFGFKELPNFLQPENYLKAAEMSMEDDYNMVDGIINNGPKQPTVAELKEQVKSGQSISLLDLAEAVQREKEEKRQKSTPEKKAQPEKKPSILAKIHKPLPPRGEKKTAPEKSADKEFTR